MEEVKAVAWKFGFACPADSERTKVIELQIGKGGCPVKEPVVFKTRTSNWDSSLSRPQGLPAGNYAFYSTALDGNGEPIASSCNNVELPSDEVVYLEMQGKASCADGGAEQPADAGGESEVDGGTNHPPKPDSGVTGSCPNRSDRDGDGTLDCVDGCPDDGAKIAEGQCGCSIPDTDQDRDGTPNCHDDCPTDPNKAVRGTCGCNVKNTLGPGERLVVGGRICGPRDDGVLLTMEADGNLHLVVDGVQTWVTNAKLDSVMKPGVQVKMQGDGNLVIRSMIDEAVWSSDTVDSNAPNMTVLAVNADGTVTLTRKGLAVWTVTREGVVVKVKP